MMPTGRGLRRIAPATGSGTSDMTLLASGMEHGSTLNEGRHVH